MSAARKKKLLQGVIKPDGAAELPEQLKQLAREIAGEIAGLDPSRSEELLSVCITELALYAADERRRKERKARQMECIADAKARGVRFGRRPIPLPDDFDEYHQAWRDGQFSLQEAAGACGMTKASFYNAVLRKERMEDENPA